MKTARTWRFCRKLQEIQNDSHCLRCLSRREKNQIAGRAHGNCVFTCFHHAFCNLKATDRAHRIGQTQKVSVYYLVSQEIAFHSTIINYHESCVIRVTGQ